MMSARLAAARAIKYSTFRNESCRVIFLTICSSGQESSKCLIYSSCYGKGDSTHKAYKQAKVDFKLNGDFDFLLSRAP